VWYVKSQVFFYIVTFFVALVRPAMAENERDTNAPTPAVKLAAESVDGGYYARVLDTLAGGRPVPGIPNNYWLSDRNSSQNLAVSREFLKREIEALGFKPEEIKTQDWTVQQWVEVGYDDVKERPIMGRRPPFRAQNMWFEIRGSSRPDEVVTVGAHYDTIFEGVPGANDNATGVTAVLSMAKVFKEKGIRPKRTIRFVLFDQEEPPHMADGSERFFESRLKSHQRDVLFVNIDMIGFSPLGSEHSGYSAAEFPKAKRLIRRATNEADLGVKPKPFDEFYSDNLSASERGIPALAFTEDGRDHRGRQVEDPHNHTRNDRAEEINVPYAIRMTKWATATVLLAADSRAEFGTPESEALYALARANVRAGRRFDQGPPPPPIFKPWLDPVKPLPVELKPEPLRPPPVEIKPEPVKPPVEEKKPEPVLLPRPPPVEIKPEPVVLKPPPVEIKPEPVKPPPVEVKPEPVKLPPVEIKPAPYTPPVEEAKPVSHAEPGGCGPELVKVVVGGAFVGGSVYGGYRFLRKLAEPATITPPK